MSYTFCCLLCWLFNTKQDLFHHRHVFFKTRSSSILTLKEQLSMGTAYATLALKKEKIRENVIIDATNIILHTSWKSHLVYWASLCGLWASRLEQCSRAVPGLFGIFRFLPCFPTNSTPPLVLGQSVRSPLVW